MRAVVAVGVTYEQDISKAMRVLDEVGRAWAEEHRGIVLEPPQVQGILAFDESSIALRLAIKVKPSQQGAAELELRRRLKEAFDREGVEIPILRSVFYTKPEPNNAKGQGQSLQLVSKRVQRLEKAQEGPEK